MDHLRDSFVNISTDDVDYFHSLNECLERGSSLDPHAVDYRDHSWLLCHGPEYRNFIGFPKAHGIVIDNQYKIVRYGDLKNELPRGDCCWLPNSSSANSSLLAAGSSKRSMTPDEFLQAWLFFGLIRCVVRHEDGVPILSYRELWMDADDKRRRQLSTKHLPKALKTWQDALAKLYRNHPEKAELRCIQAIQMLSLAKRVVTTNLSEGSVGLGLPEFALQNPDPQFHQRSLCLMILGETLCAALTQIMNHCNIKIADWEMDQEGWGRPVLVSERMEKNEWCPRFQAVLKGQLGKNATLLYAAVAETLKQNSEHGRESAWMVHEGGGEKRCSPDRCYYVEAHNASEEYETQHALSCKDKSCRSVGPDQKDLKQSLHELKNSIDEENSILRFPLLRVTGEGEEATLQVKQWSEGVQFATISHVWSQGLGNRSGPKIWSCQIKYIQSLLKLLKWGEEKEEGTQGNLFWLDTLLSPPRFDEIDVGEEEMAGLRRASVKSIFDVYDRATHGVIIDRHVMRSNGAKPRTIGIHLLSSGWMKRLWTLQEAFVTRSLSIALQGGPNLEVRDLDDLFHLEESNNTDFKDLKATARLQISMTDMVREKVFQNLMGDVRKARNGGHGDNTTPWPLLIASAWNSARYRDVGELEKETFALASLLNISFDKETYEKGQQWRREKLREDDPKRKQTRMELMRTFWNKIDEKGGIHPGMIFLPGERLALEGFAWAPMTWMSSKDESYPYPLTTLPLRPARLDSSRRGLVVQYPGYVLRVTRERCREILAQPRLENGQDESMMDESSGFEFSVSLGLYDLYQARNFPDEQADRSVIDKLVRQLDRENAKGLKLGIILSRSRPVDFPCEIGILVEIYDPKTKSDVIHCRIIRRLKLSRLTVYPSSLVRAPDSHNASILDVYHAFDGQVIAEAVNEHQKWCVDGYISEKRESIADPEGASPAGPAGPSGEDLEAHTNTHQLGQTTPQENAGQEALPSTPPIIRSETGFQSIMRRMENFNIKRKLRNLPRWGRSTSGRG
ncbi:hypothetical protein QBC38DRAFT_505288 [Podospora fimiseda]|uniref:Heterokaryon incompatibility domain-containing protein n=1 Tax=Podospora fimiseda TaxID=252190 RepID=A0AAN7BGF1_9PEZI|nr:hypothetical protein QBC38DRAFT_505288 [Podospora fimiseda]